MVWIASSPRGGAEVSIKQKEEGASKPTFFSQLIKSRTGGERAVKRRRLGPAGSCHKCKAGTGGSKCRKCQNSVQVSSSAPQKEPARKVAKPRRHLQTEGCEASKVLVVEEDNHVEGLGMRAVAENFHLSPANMLCSEELRMHIMALRTEFIQRSLRPLLTRLMVHPSNKSIFNTPVDAAALGLVDYHIVIKNPMDLGTVKGRLQSLYYSSMEGFATDVRLVSDNARRYVTSTMSSYSIFLLFANKKPDAVSLIVVV